MPGLDAEVVVVGAGVVGAAAAYALAANGRRVLLLEQHAVGHAAGSSHGSSRIFRLSYPDERYVRLAQASLVAWRALEERSGRELLVTTGSLDLGKYAVDNARALRGCGARFELVDGRTAATRWPLAVDPAERLLHQPDGGVLLAERAWRALVESAVAEGATLQEHARVLTLADRGRTVRVETEARSIEARCVVVTAGAWAAQLLSGAGVDLPVVATRETVAHFRLPDELGMPAVIDDHVGPADGPVGRAGELTYALASPGIGLKVGLHHSGPAAHPDRPGAPDDRIVAWAAAWAARRVPAASPEPALVETCLYTNTADESFVLERHGRIVVGSACSGHGFKFAPSLGRTLAALASEPL